MLRIEDTIFSLDLFERKFICNLPQCLGNCCRYGDSGAPLLNDEVHILKNLWPTIRHYLRQEGIDTINEKGTSVTDFENENVTPLIGNEECAYTVIKDNILMCGIERAWQDCKTGFQKPLSCHLFPVRIKQFTSFRAVNYEALSICSGAREKGCSEDVYVYEFLKEPLIRALGTDIYIQLCIAATELKKNNSIK
jgi:hypothetical protein